MTDSARQADRAERRVTPYELIFGGDVFDQSRFAAVREQTDVRDAASPAQLFMTPAAGELLRELTPPEGGREAVAQVSVLLYSAYRFWLHGCHVYRLAGSVVRELLADGHDGPASVLPAPAGYVQLPRHLVWARVSDEGPAEPVDGFFWSAEPHGTGPLDLLFALGVRAGRPGISTFDVTIEPAAHLDQWADVTARADGVDFANILPGGELQGYHAIVTAAEALKLAALCFSHIADPARHWDDFEESGQTVHMVADG